MARALMLAVLATLAAATPSGAVQIGLSDQDPATWSDGRVRELKLQNARLVAPWDAALREPERVRAWLDAVAAAGMRPHVAFERARGPACPWRACGLPTRAEYATAVRAFLARFPEVTTFTTWNEANHPAQPVARRPETVAGYYEELRAACPACTIVAVDVLDRPGYIGWIERFKAVTHPDPRLWGLNNYPDATHGTTSGTDRMLAAVPGRLWVEETGGIVTMRVAGVVLLPSDETRAADAVRRALAITRARPRIERAYVYQWRALPQAAVDRECPTCPYFDAGLVRPDGSARPSYWALRSALDGGAAPGGSVPASPRWRSWWAGRYLKIRLTCRIAGSCRGRVRVVLRTRGRRARRWRSRFLATRTYRTSARRATTTLRIRVSKKLRRRARRARYQRVALTVRATLPRPRASRIVLAPR